MKDSYTLRMALSLCLRNNVWQCQRQILESTMQKHETLISRLCEP